MLCRVLLGAAVVLAAQNAVAEECSEIRFKRGEYHTIVSGSAPAKDALCYTIGVAPGQKISLEMMVRGNVAITVPGVSDARTELSFTAQKRRYRINVFQLFDAARPEGFDLYVEVR